MTDLAGAPAPVIFEWARYGKLPGDHEGYRVLACSSGAIGGRNFREAIANFDLGTPEELPQVAVSYVSVSLTDQPERRYLALAVAEYQGNKDATGRLIAYTRYFCAPYWDMATTGTGYLAMFHAIGEVSLPWTDGPPAQVAVPAVPVPMPSAGDLAVRVAAMLLTGRNVCVLGAGRVSHVERLRFIDGVMSLLPYGMRAKMSAATWTRSTSQHRFRLFFSDNPRPPLDDKLPDLVAIWGRPDQAQPIPSQYPYAQEYLYWLANALRSPGETLAGHIDETGFSPSSVMGMLRKIGVITSAAAPGASATPVPPPDHATRILVDIDGRIHRHDLGGLRADVTTLGNLVNRQLQASAGQLPDSVRKRYQDVIVGRQLLRPELQEQLGAEAGAYNRSLLRLAFGLPLSYQGYCQLEDCVRANGLPIVPLPAALLHAIRRERSTDERVTALVMAGLGEQAMAEWFKPKLVNLADLAGCLAATWEHPQHARIVCDVFMWYLRTMHQRFKPAPAKVVAALRPYGYLAPVLQARYPDELRYQVEVLTSILVAASGERALRENDIVDVLRGGDFAPTWALLCAVLRLLSTDDQRLSILAQDAYFAGMLAKSGVGQDIRVRLDQHLSPDVAAIYQRLAGEEATQPMSHRMLEQARGPAALPVAPVPSFNPAPSPPPRPEKPKVTPLGWLGGKFER